MPSSVPAPGIANDDSTFGPSGSGGLRGAKLRVLRAALSSGLAGVVRDSEWRRRRLLILAYHGISLADEHEWDPELFLPVHALRGRFEILRAGGYTVLPLQTALDHLEHGTLPPRAVALTFDDGNVDFHRQAVPLLREFGFPATVYVTSYYAEKEVPVFRVASRYLLWRGRGRSVPGRGLSPAVEAFDLRTTASRDSASEAILQHVRSLGGGLPLELETLRVLADRVGVDWNGFIDSRMLQVMSADEIRSLPSDLVSVQLHTHRHRVPLDAALFRREIEDNRRFLEPLVGRPLTAFCYPSGVTDRRFLPWLHELGVTSATTCRVGLASPRSHRLLLPRLIDTWSRDRAEFEGWLTGVAGAIPRLPNRRRYPVTAAYG